MRAREGCIGELELGMEIEELELKGGGGKLMIRLCKHMPDIY